MPLQACRASIRQARIFHSRGLGEGFCVLRAKLFASGLAMPLRAELADCRGDLAAEIGQRLAQRGGRRFPTASEWCGQVSIAVIQDLVRRRVLDTPLRDKRGITLGIALETL